MTASITGRSNATSKQTLADGLSESSSNAVASSGATDATIASSSIVNPHSQQQEMAQASEPSEAIESTTASSSTANDAPEEESYYLLMEMKVPSSSFHLSVSALLEHFYYPEDQLCYIVENGKKRMLSPEADFARSIQEVLAHSDDKTIHECTEPLAPESVFVVKLMDATEVEELGFAEHMTVGAVRQAVRARLNLAADDQTEGIQLAVSATKDGGLLPGCYDAVSTQYFKCATLYCWVSAPRLVRPAVAVPLEQLKLTDTCIPYATRLLSDFGC